MGRPLKSQTLFAREAPAAPRPKASLGPREARLWISVCLPNLALESLGAEHNAAVAVTEPGPQQFPKHYQIAAVNERARALGIEPGIHLSAALALCASLKLIERSPRAEHACLESLLTWAQRITPTVSLEPPESFLLEVAGSLKLFGGLSAIKTMLAAELAARGLSFKLCAAPTPLASLWLARNRGGDVFALEQLSGALSSLPLRVTRWPAPVRALLQDMGIRTLGDCLRLPRDGFARRVGRDFLDDLDKASAKRFDPRADFAAPARFRSRAELSQETSDRALFVEAIDGMLDGLIAKLRARQSQIQSVSVGFEHRRGDPTVEHFALTEPSHEKDRLMHLIGDRLERLVLPVPATALTLSTGFLQPMRLRLPGLFGAAADETGAYVLIERLRERFGVDGVYGVGLAAEHRPEHAWARIIDDFSRPSSVLEISTWTRPLWVLPLPLPLSSSAARNLYAGPLQLRSLPERIESGWWDGADVKRDYYTAAGACGQRLWIYQDRDSGDWHLHGIFG